MRYLFLVVLTLAMTVPGIGSLPPLDRDESRYVQATKQMVETGDYIDIRFQDQSRYKKPVGIYWMQSVAVEAGGQGAGSPIWIYRLVSILGALITVAAVFWTATRLFGPGAGLVSALTMAAIFGVVFEAHIAKTDSMLLAATTLAQGALAQIHARRKKGEGPSTALFWVFWLAMGAGVLIKGPITPLLAFLTIAALWFIDRDRSWLRDVRIGRGLLLVAIIALPWLVAITIKSGGAFWQESVGKDLLGKAAGGQESHGAPPGYYVLTYGLYVWPFGPLFLAAGLAALNRLRADPRLAFLISWYIPFWLMFEAIPTKLPHYVLPAYPALALLAGWAFSEAVDIAPAALRRWQRWLYWLSVLGQAAVTIAIAGLAIAGPVYLGGGFSISGLVVAIAALAAGWLALPRGGRVHLRSVGYTVGASVVVYALFFAFVAPSMTQIWMSPRIEAAFEAARPCDGSRLASVHFHEPSLVFLAGTDTLLTDVKGAARHLLADPACAVALVPDTQADDLARIAGEGGATLEPIGRIDGLNYSKGERLSLRMFRVAP